MVSCSHTSARRVRTLTNAVRFWGWTENDREHERAKEEVASGKVAGIGASSLSPEMQGAAFRNSLFSQLNFGTLSD